MVPGIKLNIKINFNYLIHQLITYHREAKQSRVMQECPHAFPTEEYDYWGRPRFRSTRVLDDDGGFECSLCGLTGVTTEEIEASIDAYLSTMTPKEWIGKMDRRNKALGIKTPNKANVRKRRTRRY